MFYELNEEGTYRYIQNIAGWTARPEVFIAFGRGPNPKDWRPKAVNMNINFNDYTGNYSQHVKNLISQSNSCKMTSVIKDNVRKLGGNVNGVLRFSIQWSDDGSWDKNDLDAHCIEPRGNEIYYSNMHNSKTNGVLDVDITNPNEGDPACENITWPDINTMERGRYRFFVHQFHYRNGHSGFRAEIEFNGRIYSYDYRQTFSQDEEVNVAYVTLENSQFSIEHCLPCI